MTAIVERSGEGAKRSRRWWTSDGPGFQLEDAAHHLAVIHHPANSAVDLLVARLVEACASGVSASAIEAGVVLSSSRFDEPIRSFAILRSAELRLDSGDLMRAGDLLSDSIVDPTTSADASALLALVLALQGHARRARVLSRPSPADGNLSSACRVARFVAEAVANAQTTGVGRRPWAAGHPAVEGAVAGSRPLRTCLRVMRATNREETWLDSATARHPLASHVLVALGILDVVELSGGRIPLGGPAERALVRAREAMSHDAFAAALTDIGSVTDHATEVHPRTRIELATLAAAATESLGRTNDATASLSVALDLAADNDVTAPLLENAHRVQRSLASLSSARGHHQRRARGLLRTVHDVGSDRLGA